MSHFAPQNNSTLPHGINGNIMNLQQFTTVPNTPEIQKLSPLKINDIISARPIRRMKREQLVCMTNIFLRWNENECERRSESKNIWFPLSQKSDLCHTFAGERGNDTHSDKGLP